MDDIFALVKCGDAVKVKAWLDNSENDLNIGDDHRFSLLHWASMMGRLAIGEALLLRGARVNATNMGDDTPLHLAASRGHYDVCQLLVRHKALVNAVNSHGNTPLHYACFWNFDQICEFLIESGALVMQLNKYRQIPLDLCKMDLAKRLKDHAVTVGQELIAVAYQDRSWLNSKTRSGDATINRTADIRLEDLQLRRRLRETHSGTTYLATYRQTDVAAKMLRVKDLGVRVMRDFNEEYPRLRIFNHPNVLPLLAVSADPSRGIALISSLMSFGSLFEVLHGNNTGLVIDHSQALRFAVDIARGMEYLHMLDPLIPNMFLNSKHVLVAEDLARIGDPEYLAHSHSGNAHSMIDEELTAKINMADYKFSFQEKHQLYNPAWMAPEALKKASKDINTRAADMWSFGILLWELATREVPFSEYSPMECGMKICTENMRIKILPGISKHIERLVSLCTNEDPGKRPRFDMIIPVLERMRKSSAS